MKIAIQGHPTRGKEVIQILESLGGNNLYMMTGSRFSCYFINNYYNIDGNSLEFIKKLGYTIYTLEEFEKEFPFKIGDLCIYQSEYAGDIIVKVLRMIIQDNDIVYEIGHKDTDKTYSGIYRRRDTLKPYKEMKEERNITLTLDKAKEWYKKGGELKEIALQAFTEKELTKVGLPKTWEEFCVNYPTKDGMCYIDNWSNIRIISSCNNDFRNRTEDKNLCPSKKSAEAHLAMIQLEQLRDCWRQGWKPKEHEPVYAIKFSNRCLAVYQFNSREFLSFPTKEMAEEFLKCFKDLIEKAGDLI